MGRSLVDHIRPHFYESSVNLKCIREDKQKDIVIVRA
jgi:hypothetical protein